jgi:hypothetical protein
MLYLLGKSHAGGTLNEDCNLCQMNPIPDIEYYRSEIEAVRPMIVEQDLNKIM